MSRRIAPLIALALLALAPAGAQAARGFDYGVAAGEVTHNSAHLWARANSAGRGVVEVSRDRRFRKGVKDATVNAEEENDFTVQRVVKRLRPDTAYFYKFTIGRNFSDVGRFRTAPRPRANETIEFAFSGDADATPDPNTGDPFYNNFEVYDRMQREGNHFNVNLGDTIYSDTEVGATVVNGEFVSPNPALSVEDKWGKYKQNLDLGPLQRMRSRAGSYSHWDDHEFINDFSVEEDGTDLYTAGVKAFTDYAPVTYTNRNGLYRSFRWGRNLEVFLLDGRSFRDAKASAGGTCNNPETNAPDLAPTLPKRLRDFFAVLIPSLRHPVAPECIARINDPERDMLGQAQYNRFTQAINDSTATFKVVFSEFPMMQFYALPYDRWEGYEAERDRLLQFLQDNVENVVIMSTDNHANYYNEVRYETLTDDPNFVPQGSGIFEMSTGPVATLTQKKEIDECCGGQGQAVSDYYATPPPTGPGMQCAATDVYSYSEVRVNGRAMTITPKDMNGRPVTEADGDACGPFTIQAK